MTSISSSGVDSSSSPFPRVQNAIQRDVAAGAVSAADETALTAALGDIASQLAAGSSATGATPSTANTPASMKDRVGSLIDNEVSTGKLTSDQGSELKMAFEQVHAHMHGAHGHHGGVGGLLAALIAPSATTDEQSSTDATTAANAPSNNPLETAATTAVSALEAFITQFKAAVSSNGLYGATGASSSGATSLLVNSIG